MWDGISLNNQGELACSLVMRIVFVVHIAWDRPPVCFGWVGWCGTTQNTQRACPRLFSTCIYICLSPTLILARLLVRILMPAQRSFSATATCDYMI